MEHFFIYRGFAVTVLSTQYNTSVGYITPTTGEGFTSSQLQTIREVVNVTFEAGKVIGIDSGRLSDTSARLSQNIESVKNQLVRAIDALYS